MLLHPPFEISSRLLPALRVGGAVIQVEYSKRPGRDGRVRYQYTIDLPDGREYVADDLQSGCGGGTLQEGFESLLCFLGACGESVNYQTRTGGEGENADLFPDFVAEWASQNTDELAMVQCGIEESETELIEE